MKKIDYANYKTPSDYIKFEEGKNLVRIVSGGGFMLQHGMKTASRWVNLGECTGLGCEQCAKDNEPKKRWVWIAYDYRTGEVGVLEVGAMVGDSICKIGVEHGDPQEYDIEVTRTGIDRNTKYAVKMVVNKEGLGAEVIKNIEPAKQRLIKKYFKKD